MVFYLTTAQYNGISTLTDKVGSLELSWLDFIQFYGNVTIEANDLLALQQGALSYTLEQHIGAFEWAQAIPLIANGANSLQLTVGAITGSYIIGEVVNQATSAASGTIYSVTSNGTGGWFVVINGVSGTFDSTHVITGFTSGATSTPTALSQSPNVTAFTNLGFLFGANLSLEETSQNPFTFLLSPGSTYEYAEPLPADTNFNAVFSNLRANTSATFALYYVNGTLINTQNVTTDGDGTAVVPFNTGVLSGGTAEIMIKITQQVADAISNMRGVISMTRTLFAQVS